MNGLERLIRRFFPKRREPEPPARKPAEPESGFSEPPPSVWRFVKLEPPHSEHDDGHDRFFHPVKPYR